MSRRIFCPDTCESWLVFALEIAMFKTSVEDIHEYFVELTDFEWEELYRHAVRQGVQALVLDTILSFPEFRHPPRELKLKWALNAEKIEQNYKYYCEVAARLASTLDEAGIQMMQLKGLGLAQYYHIPSHREGGDIDIYLFGDYERANRLMEERNIPVDTSYPKHSTFYFEHLPIENHQTFLNVEMFAADRLLEKHLQRYLAEEEPRYFTVEGRKIQCPGPNFNTLFLARHATAHFAAGGIVLRHLCDWSLFLTAHHKEIDFPAIEQILKEAGILHIVNAITGNSIEWLGLDDRYFPPYKPNEDLERFVLKEILEPDDFTPPANASILKILFFKCRRLFATRKKYEAVYGKTFHQRLWNSIVEHIKRPETILKLQ